VSPRRSAFEQLADYAQLGLPVKREQNADGVVRRKIAGVIMTTPAFLRDELLGCTVAMVRNQRRG
jgi:hypothetical protein